MWPVRGGVLRDDGTMSDDGLRPVSCRTLIADVGPAEVLARCGAVEPFLCPGGLVLQELTPAVSALLHEDPSTAHLADLLEDDRLVAVSEMPGWCLLTETGTRLGFTAAAALSRGTTLVAYAPGEFLWMADGEPRLRFDAGRWDGPEAPKFGEFGVGEELVDRLTGIRLTPTTIAGAACLCAVAG